ncbi:MAG: hypothetical protein KAK04_00365 [Cyclobacteriaceae bacterium]|nr:hypothetical protein [Cyclobacteriaceae bacterium]
METQDFNKELLDYIYGEMTAGEKKEFEQKLSEDAGLRKEFEELNSVRQELNKLKDKEIMEPFSTWGRSRSSSWFGSNSRRKIVVFRPVTAVAASLLILMLVGFLTNFSISINDQGLFLGFGNRIQTSDVKALVRRELDENNKMLLTKLTESENSYNNKFIAVETSLSNAMKANEKSVVTREDLQNLFTSAENKNTELIREYLKLTTTQQQQYFTTMLTQFNDYMLEQRSEDLTMIRNSLIELKQSQNVQKQETDQVIASILTTVNQQ